MAKNALQKIEEHEKLCRIMQKQTHDKIKNIISPLSDVMGKAPVAPLPNTPAPKVKTASIKNPITNLTRTESALLSPEEQVIARRT